MEKRLLGSLRPGEVYMVSYPLPSTCGAPLVCSAHPLECRLWRKADTSDSSFSNMEQTEVCSWYSVSAQQLLWCLPGTDKWSVMMLTEH
jgi:hypothetical protein